MRVVTVEFKERRVEVAFDPSRVSPAVIADTVRSLGFGVEFLMPVTEVKT